MKRTLFTVLGFTLVLLPGLAPAQNAVTDWNNIAAKAAVVGNSVIPANSPSGTALYLAYLHIAIHNAVNAIRHRYQPYRTILQAPAGGSVEAAAAYTVTT